MAAPTSIAVYTLTVDFDGDGLFTSAYEDVSADMLAVSFKRGRDFASQLTGRSSAGSLTATLDNTAARYSPFYTASPLAGLLLPGRRVQLTATWNGVTYTLFTGRLASLKPQPDRGGVHTCQLQATGPLGYINQRKPQTAVQSAIRTDTAIGLILDAAGWPTPDRSLAAGQTEMADWWADGSAVALDALRAIEETERGFLREGPDGAIVFEDRHYRLGASAQVPAALFAQDGTGLYYRQIDEEDPLQDIYNAFTIGVRSFTVDALAVLWTLAFVGADSPLIQPGASRSFTANYPNTGAPQDAVAVAAWTTPVATTDYLANALANGLGANLTGSVTVAAVKYATQMVITLTNTGGTAAYITFLQARGTPLLEGDLLTLPKDDAASQGRYGVRDYPVPAPWLSDVGEATDYLDFIDSIYSGPLPIEGIGTVGNLDDAHMTAVLTLDVSDRITVANDNLGIAQDFFIEAVSHQIDRSGIHGVTYALSDAVSYSDFWVVGYSALGVSTRPAY